MINQTANKIVSKNIEENSSKGSMTEPFHGLLLVRKQAGLTSHDLVDQVRRVFHTKSVGHCGTLDPMASGLMVLLIGEATKLSNYILEQDKAYRLRAQLGLVTDTLDTTGVILKTEKVDLSEDKVRETAICLQGELTLPVPMYSAVKIGGIRMHEFARKGEAIEAPVRMMRFYDFKNFKQGTDWIEFDMGCSKGSYVRAWIHEFGQKLGCGAAMSALERTGSAPYSITQAHTIEEISECFARGEISEYLLPMEVALPNYKFIRLSGLDETLFSNGQISYGLKSQLISIFKPGLDEGVKVLSRSTGKLMGLVGIESGKGFVIRRVFKY